MSDGSNGLKLRVPKGHPDLTVTSPAASVACHNKSKTRESHVALARILASLKSAPGCLLQWRSDPSPRASMSRKILRLFIPDPLRCQRVAFACSTTCPHLWEMGAACTDERHVRRRLHWKSTALDNRCRILGKPHRSRLRHPRVRESIQVHRLTIQYDRCSLAMAGRLFGSRRRQVPRVLTYRRVR